LVKINHYGGKAHSQLAQLAQDRPQVNPQGTIAIVVDDGIATGMTMAVAAQALRAQHPAAVLLCAPVAPLALLLEEALAYLQQQNFA